jgi:membrane-associated protein
MEFLHTVLDFFLHLDDHLAELLGRYGKGTYLLLFLIIFAETGLVVTPFLPGDSLLFAAGALSARVEGLSVGLLFLILTAAAILGDTVNYAIGNVFGRRLLARRSRLINPHHIAKTHAFFEKYGGKTIVLARFVPIVRTFAPVLAGVGEMPYRTFVTYNVAGGALWAIGVTLAGYFLSELLGDSIDRYLLPIILAIVLISLIPPVIETLRARRRRTVNEAQAEEEAEELEEIFHPDDT